jgi:outer membrane protein TolC
MHRRIPTLLLGFSLLLPALSGAAPAIALDLAQTLARAQEANFELLIAGETLTSTRQAVQRVRAGLLPSVSLDASQVRSAQPSVGGGAVTRSGNRFDALLRARLALLDLNAIADYQIAKYNVEIAEARLDDTVQDVLQLIAVAYFQHLRERARLEVIDASLARDRVLLAVARNQFEGGVATPLDVTRAEVRLAVNELARLQQETVVMESALQFKRTLNLPLAAELALQPVPIPAALPLADGSASGFAAALKQRADYRIAIDALERNRYARRATTWERLPSVELSGNWGYAGEMFDETKQEQWRIGIGLSMPLFDGFRIRANQLQADAAVRAQTYAVASIEQQIEAEYLFAVQDLRSRYAQVEVARKTVALNRREFELARNRFEEGVADNADVVTAQARLAEAEGELVNAEFAFHVSKIRFARVRGEVRDILNP